VWFNACVFHSVNLGAQLATKGERFSVYAPETAPVC
jgi:hypothetical protein